MSLTSRHEATYYRNGDSDPASQFDIYRVETEGDEILYAALSKSMQKLGPVENIAEIRSGLEVRPSGAVHTIESHGMVADMTTAMLTQIAFLQLSLDFLAAQEHEVRAVTPEPEAYERALGMKLETVGDDGKALLSGTVGSVLGRAATTLNAQTYKIMWHRDQP